MLRLVLLALLLITPAQARNSGQWADVPTNIREWFRTLMQPDNPQVSCCGEADAYEADSFTVEGGHTIAIITDGHGVIPDGTRVAIPDKKMKWDSGNPTTHGIVFIGSSGQVYCYISPAGI